MNLDRLELFLYIVESGSISAAAHRVGLTQPAVSRNVKLLEEALRADLFERRGRGLVLTAAGRALVPQARALLESSTKMCREVSRAARRRYFDVRLGSVDSVVSYLFPHLVSPIREAFPELCLKLSTARTMDLLERLESDSLDLAVVAYSGDPPVERHVRIGPYDMRFYGRRDAFPGLAEVEEEGGLAEFPMVEIESLVGQPSLIAQDGRSFAVANSLASVKALVMSGFGVGALLDFMLTPEEEAVLVVAGVPHDPDCGLYAVAAPSWQGEAEDDIFAVVVDSLRKVVKG